ncbi:MAG: ankyrin repeat domain-containing protein, partial [Fibromonadaceae bacterium]|nr:ankyrin repeat domain-containing protein [Fibromonadaceae bacterium]
MSMVFFNLCASGKLDEAKQAVDGVDLGFKDPGRRTALAFAAGRGHLEVVKWLIEMGSPLEEKETNGRTALVCAIVAERLEVVKALLDAGADINTVNKMERSALINAITEKKVDMALFLIEQGADFDLVDNMGRTALHYAAQLGYTNIVKSLIERGASLDIVDKYKTTPLDLALEEQQSAIAEMIKQALENEAVQSMATFEGKEPVLVKDSDGSTVSAYEMKTLISQIPNLRTAIEKRDVPMVQYYIAQGEDVNQFYVVDLKKKTFHRTMMAIAIEKRNPEIVRLLLEAGVDVNERFYSDEDFTPEATKLMKAAGYDPESHIYFRKALHEDLVKVYNDSGRDLFDRLRNPRFGIYVKDYMVIAMEERNIEIIRLLLEAGFDVTRIPESRPGYAPTLNSFYLEQLLCKRDFPDNFSQVEPVFPLLLEAAGELELASIQNVISNIHGKIQNEQLHMLFAKSPDINEQDNNGMTLLHWLIREYNNKYENEFLDVLLLQDGLDVNLLDYKDYSPLYYACAKGDADVVKQLLQIGADADVLCGRDSMPLTLAACRARKKDVLEALCEYGADVNVTDSSGQSLLHDACAEMDGEWIKLLIDYGAEVSATDDKGNTPLHILLSQGLVEKRSIGSQAKPPMSPMKRNALRAELIDLLLENGAELDALNHDLQTPFFLCCIAEGDHMHTLKHLLSLGAMVDVQDIRNNTCLHYVANGDNTMKVKFLLDAGADGNVQNSESKSPYQVALENNRRAAISMFEKADITITMDGDDMDAAFMRACKNGRRGVAEMLIKAGNIDVTYVDDYGRTPLHYIAKMGMVALAKFVINQGVDINYTDNAGQTALHFAAGNTQKEIFKLLVESGADLTIADDKGILPIHLITDRGQHDMLHILLQNGASVETVNNAGQSLLHMACHTRSRECVRILLDRGLNPDVLDNSNVTPLVISVNANQKEIVKMLLNAGADVNTRDLEGYECIHIAIMRRYKDMLALLLENGVKINALNNSGLAPLHLAAYFGYKDIFKFLLDKGADFDLKTGAGKSCIDIAAENGQKELIELIGIIQKRRALNNIGESKKTDTAPIPAITKPKKENGNFTAKTEKTFDSQFAEIQSDMVSLCLNYCGNKASDVYIVVAYSETDGSSSFTSNFFFKINGKLHTKGDLQKDLGKGIGNIPKSMLYDAVSALNVDVEKLIKLCKEHERPMPAVMKLIYNVQTENLEADCKNEPSDDAIWELTEKWIASLEGTVQSKGDEELNDIIETMRGLESFSPWKPASNDEIAEAERELELHFA